MPLRKLKLQVQMTIDGYMAGTNGELDWTVRDWDDELKKYVGEITRSVDCILLGRKLAQGFIPYWASHPHEEGAEIFNQIRKIVFSKTLEKSEWDNTILAKDDLVPEIMKLKEQDGGDMITYGGAAFASALIRYGLIDEFQLFVNPVVIAKGISIFKEVENREYLHLVKATTFDCGIVVLNYAKRS